MVRCRTWSAELLGRVTVKEFVKIHETESIYIPTGAVHQLEKSRPQRRFGKGADFVADALQNVQRLDRGRHGLTPTPINAQTLTSEAVAPFLSNRCFEGKSSGE